MTVKITSGPCFHAKCIFKFTAGDTTGSSQYNLSKSLKLSFYSGTEVYLLSKEHQE
jgi:hypothetical protein